ncbi:MAG: hypothetical protein ACLTD2_05095 [Ruminococcus sp.]
MASRQLINRLRVKACKSRGQTGDPAARGKTVGEKLDVRSFELWICRVVLWL